MRKGERTRQQILERASGAFNRRGYAATTVTDLMAATGLNKGGLYHHFESKEAIAIAAFDDAAAAIAGQLRAAVESQTEPLNQLEAILGVYTRNAEAFVGAGGSPLVNAAVDGDHAFAALGERARSVFSRLHKRVEEVVWKGILFGEIEDRVDATAFASAFVSTLEGAMLQAQLYKDPAYVEHAVTFLRGYIASVRT